MNRTSESFYQSLYQSFYLTTAIPYVNGRPHLGFALELVLADALARFHRQRGADVRLLSGTDENSLKNVRAARAAGVETRTLVARNADRFELLRTALDLSFDDFIRTSSDPRHRPAVEALWRRCAERGDVYRSHYRGLYCVGCEHFLSASDLVDGRCPDHDEPPERVDEENWFFRLSRYQEPIRELLESGQLAIEPAPYRNEVLAFVRRGLEDFSISRSRARADGWGIPVPGDPEQVVYVWFDALVNYVSALDFGEAPGPAYSRWWQDSAGRVCREHVIGKGITRFHAVYWPAILLSAGLPLPDRLLVHGYLTQGGEKISKSRGTGEDLDPYALASDFGSDALRYHLLRHTRSHQDSDVTRADLERSYRSELADQLGNLLQRTLRLAERCPAGAFSALSQTALSQIAGEPAAPDLRRALVEQAESVGPQVAKAVESFQLHLALDAIWQLVAAGNRYLEATEPWRTSGPASAAAIADTLELLRIIALHLTPFLPGAARRIAHQLGVGDDARALLEASRFGRPAENASHPPGPPLFPRRDVVPSND
jgi:methionyl-tRNA synthetase